LLKLNWEYFKKRGIALSRLDKNQTYTLEEFLLYVNEERVELYEGTPVFMAPVSFEHEGVIANIIGELTSVLKGSQCFVFSSNLLPDISIVCENISSVKNDATMLQTLSLRFFLPAQCETIGY